VVRLVARFGVDTHAPGYNIAVKRISRVSNWPN